MDGSIGFREGEAGGSYVPDGRLERSAEGNFSGCADSNPQRALLPVSGRGSRTDLGCTLASGSRWDVREHGCLVCRQEHIPGGGGGAQPRQGSRGGQRKGWGLEVKVKQHEVQWEPGGGLTGVWGRGAEKKEGT